MEFQLEGVIKTLDGVQDGTDMLIALQEDEKSDSSSKIFDDLLFLITEVCGFLAQLK